MNRRDFIKKSTAGAIVLSSISALAQNTKDNNPKLGQVLLGNSGVKVSRLAMGTGTSGWEFNSNQTRKGMNHFLELAEYAYNSGITFLDTADIYGSHNYIREALKVIPRDKVVIMSKIWTSSNNWFSFNGVEKELDKFRKQIGTDHIDIVLIHCMTSPNWVSEFEKVRDDLSKAREKGIIRTHGVSCHSLDALKDAAKSDWAEVILSRINHTGKSMDDSPEKVMPVLQQAHYRGAGVLGMKVMGLGSYNQTERNKSLEYVFGSGNVDAITVGFEKKEHMIEIISKTNSLLKA